MVFAPPGLPDSTHWAIYLAKTDGSRVGEVEHLEDYYTLMNSRVFPAFIIVRITLLATLKTGQTR